MRRGKKSLALMLVVAMVLTSIPVSAAPTRAGSYTNSWFGNFWNNLFNWNWNNNWNDSSDDEVVEEPETEVSEGQEVEQELVVEEDVTTVENGELLRASTYSLRAADAGETAEAATYGIMTAAEESGTDAAASTTTVKYFPVTMYNYDQDTINAATDALDSDLTLREGLYFSDGGNEVPAHKTTSVDLSSFVAGQYYIQNIRAAENNVNSWLQAHSDNKIYAVSKRKATVWTLSIEDGAYYLTTEIAGEKRYMVVGTGGDNDGYTATKTPISITGFSGDSGGVQLSQNGYYLCQWGGATKLDFGGYNVNNDDGNGMLFYPVDSDAPITPGGSVSTITSGYEEWNRWDKASGNNLNGDLIYTGLVQKTLVDDQIVFNVKEGGIFNDDDSVKDIYEYVGLPFVFNSGTGKYTFDSDINGVYFVDTDGDGEANPKSGTKESPYNLHFAEGNPQPMPTGLSVGDGSTNAWLPFNSESSYTTSQVDYHMGMRADLPFSMTANGRVKSTDDTSAPITFTFSGDDDVWVYIDGVLVIDLGGIHNRLDVTIDFAANTVTYSEENAQDGDNTTGSYNDSTFATTQKLFTDNDGVGLINMTRDAFAMNEEHEMQVFYLERGEGTSNCRIEFNLPMNDTVLVTKDATQSWYHNTDEVEDLTDAEQDFVNNLDFGFTLYKKDAGSSEFVKVANTNFYLLDSTGTRIAINSTDANGHFLLKNGQTAKFITEIPADGVTYYVVEDTVPEGFVTPDFNFDGLATYGYDYVNESGESVHKVNGSDIPEQILPVDTTQNKSYEVTVKGSVEANDSIEFICSNYLDATLPNPTILPNEDIIVIDYGLPVKIDPLANDVVRGDTVEILYVGSENVTVTETEGEHGQLSATYTEDDTIEFGTIELVKGTKAANDNSRDTIDYKLNKQLTEVEILTYVVQVTGNRTVSSGDDEITYTQTSTKTGKIYIVPATVMYYEENFSDLVKYENGKGSWASITANSDDISAYQEPGVVGTPNDSTYGSDVAYLNDSNDSNGTHYFGNTTNGPVRFSYTFTGTGTSIFARTSKDTGYMQVKLYKVAEDGTKAQINLTYRDTYYEDTNNSSEDSTGTLYNIPVYTESDLDYGTYMVVATVAKAGTPAAGGVDDSGNALGSGNEFYLDGIRIMQPLNEENTTAVKTEWVEKTDEEGNVIVDENNNPVMEEVVVTITDKALSAYATDGEANIEVVTLRQKMITEAELGNTPWNFVVLTDTDGEIITVEDYTSIGPKEEVYLNPGQSVSFTLKHWELDGFMLYMGMKAPFGSGKLQVGQTTYNLGNATDCYYDITNNYSSLVTKYEQAMDENGNLIYTDANGVRVYEDADGVCTYADGTVVADDAILTPVDDTNAPYYEATFTLTATDKIVSLTNIKVTGNYEFVIVEDTDINVDGPTN